jgi:hypothetical protein
MRTWIFFLAVFLCLSLTAYAQIGINPSNDPPAPSAGVDVDFTNRGFLQPRLTAEQIPAISNPAAGLMVFNLSTGKPVYYDGVTWRNYDGTLNWSGCGDPIEVIHIAGPIAPINKSVSYGTVTGVTGEPDKCWITSNLGADHQAISMDDATEPSAGWYWQFNRKQGYKYTGTTVIPTWNPASIDEDSDWLPANDPCSIELGAGWRIPTSTEWYNVYQLGEWAGLEGPWDSPLKMHAAGRINSSDGFQYETGLGEYWSSCQATSQNAYAILFFSNTCIEVSDPKNFGITVRCVKQ